MDGPLVYLLECQLHGRVAKPGRDKNHEEIDEFIRNNGIASRMVGRWFNRD